MPRLPILKQYTLKGTINKRLPILKQYTLKGTINKVETAIRPSQQIKKSTYKRTPLSHGTQN